MDGNDLANVAWEIGTTAMRQTAERYTLADYLEQMAAHCRECAAIMSVRAEATEHESHACSDPDAKERLWQLAIYERSAIARYNRHAVEYETEVRDERKKENRT